MSWSHASSAVEPLASLPVHCSLQLPKPTHVASSMLLECQTTVKHRMKSIYSTCILHCPLYNETSFCQFEGREGRSDRHSRVPMLRKTETAKWRLLWSAVCYPSCVFDADPQLGSLKPSATKNQSRHNNKLRTNSNNEKQ